MSTRIVLAALASISLLSAAIVNSSAFASDDVTATLERLDEWLPDGWYDTKDQATADEAQGLPENLQHRLMYQLFVRVEIDAIEGLIFFQQASDDGSDETATRAGLLHFDPDPEAGVVRERGLKFKDGEAWISAHKDPERLKTVTMDDLTYDRNCDFLLKLSEDKNEIVGYYEEPDICRLPAEQFGVELIAQDKVVIRPNEFWFWGRYRDADGNVMWGTESDELNKMVLRTPL